jgi:hypothetical protein
LKRNWSIVALAGCFVAVMEGKGIAMEPDAAAPQGKEAASMESRKRRVPKVQPVSRGNVRYEVVRGAKARGFEQNGGVVASVDKKSGQELWTVVLYRVQYDAAEEADAQDVYITALQLSRDGKELTVTDERKRRFAVKLADRTVREIPAPLPASRRKRAE